MGVRVTGAYSPQGGGFGPVRYGTNLYAVLQSKTKAVDFVDNYALFKSADNGATWSMVTVGGNVNAYSEGISEVPDGNFMHGCLDNDFPATPYAYIVHLNIGGVDEPAALVVTRINFDTETFDLQSGFGPTYYTGGIPEGAGNDPNKYVPSETTWAIAQFDDGSFAVLASMQAAAEFTRGRVHYTTLSADLSTWGARDEVSGQVDDDDYAVSGITRGTDGRIHGFVWSEFSTLHHVLLSTTGAGSLEEITAAEWNYRSTYSAALSGTTIRVLCAPEIGTGNTLRAFSAESADTPSFTEETVDASSGATFNSFWACLIGGAKHFAGYNLDDGANDNLFLSEYSGAWTAPLEIEPTLLPYFVTGQRMGDDLGFLFAQDGTGDETYFLLYALPATELMYSQWINGGRYGPWKYGGAWYAICFLDVPADQDADYAFQPEIQIVKSTDNGTSWAQVGTTITLTDDTVVEDFAYGAYTFGTALDLSFSTNGYIYVLYTGADKKLRVSRLNCVTEDWDLTGADGPDNPAFVDATAAKDKRVFLLLEAATDGGFAVMVGYPLGITTDEAHVLVGRIESDLTWGTLEPVDGQMVDRAYFPMGLMNGADGRVHGLLWEENATSLRILHTLVLAAGGSLANTTIEEVWAETHAFGHDPGIINGAPVACIGYFDGAVDRLMFLLMQDAGGSTFALAAAQAESEDSPTWTIDVVHSAGATGFFYTATLVDAGGTPTALFHPWVGDAEFMAATYDGAAWSATSLTGINGERIAAVYVQGAIGCFLIEQVNDTEYSYPLVFGLHGTPDTDLEACCCKIAGIYGL